MSEVKVTSEIEIGEYRGSPTLSIWEIDEDGKRKQFPIISFGVKKAKALMYHTEDIEQFIEDMKGKK